jgi:hypothetical protein
MSEFPSYGRYRTLADARHIEIKGPCTISYLRRIHDIKASQRFSTKYTEAATYAGPGARKPKLYFADTKPSVTAFLEQYDDSGTSK